MSPDPSTGCITILAGDVRVLSLRSYSASGLPPRISTPELKHSGPFFRVQLQVSNYQNFVGRRDGPYTRASYCLGDKDKVGVSQLPWLSIGLPDKVMGSPGQFYIWLATRPYNQGQV